MNKIKEVELTEDELILKAVEVINGSSYRIALIVDQNSRLIGTVTDGDVRRGLLNNQTLESQVSTIMCHKPIYVSERHSDVETLALMKAHQILQIPVLNSTGQVVTIKHREQLRDTSHHQSKQAAQVPIVLMLGGLGKRLHPLTEKVPKPMLPVGNVPLLETTVNNFVKHGFRQFYFAVNYRAEVIIEHFGDGSKFGAEIHYLHEQKKLGTAGALSLLPELPESPMIVMNGDLLTNISYRELLNFHEEHNVLGTMCVKEHKTQIPYGIVINNGVELNKIVEKPTETYYVNAGIYVIEPKALQYIPKDRYFDMPQLFDQIVAHGQSSVIYPIYEYWRDIGHPEDLKEAEHEFDQYFS